MNDITYKQIWFDSTINHKKITHKICEKIWEETRRKGNTISSIKKYQLFVDDDDNVTVLKNDSDIDYTFKFNGFMYYEYKNKWKRIR